MSVGAVNKQTGDRIPTAGMPAIDSVLSGSSTNPVQNRVVKEAFDAIKDGQNIDSFADVETALGEKADTDIVASDFSASASYTAGDYCIYEGKFYRFKNTHSGAWAAADVDEIKIAGELSALKSGLIGVGSYSTAEVNTGMVWIDGKTIYRKIVSLGALPNTTVKTVSSGLSGVTVVDVRGIAYGASAVLPLPLATAVNKNCQFYYDPANNTIVINSADDFSGYTESYAILEYTKNA